MKNESVNESDCPIFEIREGRKIAGTIRPRIDTISTRFEMKKLSFFSTTVHLVNSTSIANDLTPIHNIHNPRLYNQPPNSLRLTLYNTSRWAPQIMTMKNTSLSLAKRIIITHQPTKQTAHPRMVVHNHHHPLPSQHQPIHR